MLHRSVIFTNSPLLKVFKYRENRESSESGVQACLSIAESRTRKTIVNAAEIRRSQWAEGMGIAVASNTEIMHTLSRFGLKKFASATMYVLQTVFAMPDKYLICQPNEKEGKFLLGEIMMAGNFGKYDSRISHSTWQMGHAWEKLKHNFRLIKHYPEEVMWEPFFRVYHWIWRRFELWRY